MADEKDTRKDEEPVAPVDPKAGEGAGPEAADAVQAEGTPEPEDAADAVSALEDDAGAEAGAETAEPEDKPKPKRRSRARKADADKGDTAKAADKAEKPKAEKPKAKKPKAKKADDAEAGAAPVSTEKKKDTQRKPGRRQARRRGETHERPVVRARARYVRTAPRKARLVCDHIRGKSVEEARAILAYASRAAARDWAKLLESAVANAENNHELVAEDLHIVEVYADEGPTLKRFRPRAMGRATRIRKRTSHLTIVLSPRE